jgi:hypothetical protein
MSKNGKDVYRTVSEIFESGMDRLMAKNPEEYGRLLNSLKSYAEGLGERYRPENIADDEDRFDPVYAQIVSVSKNYGRDARLIAEWLFRYYRGSENFMERLRGASPPSPTLGRSIPRRPAGRAKLVKRTEK